MVAERDTAIVTQVCIFAKIEVRTVENGLKG